MKLDKKTLIITTLICLIPAAVGAAEGEAVDGRGAGVVLSEKGDAVQRLRQRGVGDVRALGVASGRAEKHSGAPPERVVVAVADVEEDGGGDERHAVGERDEHVADIPLRLDLFAEGALSAAAFLIGKAPGMYDMKDLVNAD